MGLISRMLKQRAVYWAPTTADQYGRVGHGDPIQIACRWEDGAFEIVGKEGTTVLAKSAVYVDRDLALGGMLWLGDVSDLVVLTPREAGAREITSLGKLPNMKATEFLRTVYLGD